jgi:hypothetical protein
MLLPLLLVVAAAATVKQFQIHVLTVADREEPELEELLI